MRWTELLSARRLRPEDGRGGGHDLRSEFEKDYHRIIVSSAFRRLQDKTQVFPLDKSDFIRTRLTHSLEVSSIGRSLAQNIGASILEKELDRDFTQRSARDICDILQCAGLIHDIGNPPFGHFGEEAIRDWFAEHFDTLAVDGQKIAEQLSPQMRRDFLKFEGNAQGFRMITKLDFPVKTGGMNLTCALMSAMIKYPCSSTAVERDSDYPWHKNGFFASEEETFREVARETGTGDCRNPLAFILEAADDIAYATADIEDAFKKGFFDYETFVRELRERGTSRQYAIRLSDLFDMARLTQAVNPEEYAIRAWLREMQEELLYAATDGFISHYRAIMNGTFHGAVIGGRKAAGLLENLKNIAYDYAFTSMSIFKTEIAAHTILTYLCANLTGAALMYQRGRYPGLMEEKFLSLISENYRQVYREASDGKSEAEKTYLRLLLATDTISGMTDSYAKDLYSELTGIL